MKGGYHPLARAEGLADEGRVHEQAAAIEFRQHDRACDAIARWAFGALRRAYAGVPGALQVIERQEAAYWAADAAEDGSVVRHQVEGVELFTEIGDLLAHSQRVALSAA